MATIARARPIPMTAAPSVATAMRASPTFAELPFGDIDRLARAAIERTYCPRQAVIRREDLGRGIYLIGSGIVKLAVQSRDGDEAILDLLGPGDLFGEGSLIGEPETTDAEAVVETSVIQIPQQDIIRLATTNAPFMLRLMANARRREQILADQLTAISFLKVEGRLAGLLLRLTNRFGEWTKSSARLDLKLTHSELAGMIGASRESVNKVLRQFSASGLISYTSQRIELLDPRALRERVDDGGW